MIQDSLTMESDTYAPCNCHLEPIENEEDPRNVSIFPLPMITPDMNNIIYLSLRIICTDCGALRDFELETVVREVEKHNAFIDKIIKDIETYEKKPNDGTNIIPIPVNTKKPQGNNGMGKVIKFTKDKSKE
jgi:transcription elongation factor Elf1